jgi:hypothetical protein
MKKENLKTQRPSLDGNSDAKGRYQKKASLSLKRLVALLTVVMFTTFTVAPSYVIAETIKVEGGSIDVNTKDNTTNWNVSGNPVWNVPEFNVPQGNIYNIAGLGTGSSLALLVNGGSASNIFGTMNLSNLDFILQNIAGINIGSTGMINLNNASLLASTIPLNLDATQFLARDYQFSGQGGFLMNNGKIIGNNADLVAMISNAIENNGVIEVPMGTVALAAGNTVTVGISGDGLVSIGVDEATANTMGLMDQIKNTGTITADGGKVIMNAKALDGLFEKAINLQSNSNSNSIIRADNGSVEFESIGDITNEGLIQAKNGEFDLDTFLGSFMNKGTIKAPEGNVTLNAGQSVYNQALLEAVGGKVEVTAQKGEVTNDGTIDVTDGKVTLTAQKDVTNNASILAPRGEVWMISKDGNIKNVGDVKADHGTIGLTAEQSAYNQMLLEAMNGKVEITAKQGEVKNTGTIDATAGTIDVTARDDVMNEALMKAAEGAISVTSTEGAITNPGTMDADKGSIDLQAAGAVETSGAMKAEEIIERGASFKMGGRIEVGTMDMDNLDNRADIAEGATLSGNFTDQDDISVLGNFSLIGDTTIQTDSDVTNDDGTLTWADTYLLTGNGHDLTLKVSKNSTVGAITGVDLLTFDTNTGKTATYTGSTSDDISVNTINITSGATFSKDATDLSGYHLIYTVRNNVGGLQYMGQNLGYNYKLANNIDASETSGWNNFPGEGIRLGFDPIGYSTGAYTAAPTNPFTGNFDGGGHTITGLYIRRSSYVTYPGENFVGLFGATSGGAITNVGLVGGSVSGNNAVGGLVGSNWSSTITSSYNTGSVGGGARTGGLVGYSGGAITSSHATGNVSGSSEVGGLVGQNKSVAITSSFATGDVSGGTYVGGLVGQNYSSASITSSYATGDVTGSGNYVGGLAGYNNSSASITTSYATGDVSGAVNVGGLVGYSNAASVIASSYALGDVSGTTDVGSLVGYNSSSAITSSFSTGVATSTGDVAAGLIGHDNSGTLENNWWYNEINSVGVGNGTPGGVTQATDAADFMNPLHQVYDFDLDGIYDVGEWDIASTLGHTWAMQKSGAMFPMLQMRHSTAIMDAHQLQLMFLDPAAVYTLTNSIDAAETAFWNAGLGFEPVGHSGAAFTGSINGASHTVSGLYIDRPLAEDVGFLGYADGASVSDIGFIGLSVIGGNNYTGGLAGRLDNSDVDGSYVIGSVTGHNNVGGMVGWFSYGNTFTDAYTAVTVSGDAGVGGFAGQGRGSDFSNAYALGNVTGSSVVGGFAGAITEGSTVNSSFSKGNIFAEGDDVGGFVGVLGSSSSLENTYATGNVIGNNRVGGLAGSLPDDDISIIHSYATGKIVGSSEVGGLLGTYAGGTLTHNYWNVQSSGQATSAGEGAGAVEGKTTVEMKQQATFSDWDFGTTWWANEGDYYPHLAYEWSTEIANVHQLQNMNLDLTATYTLLHDIDAVATAYWNYKGSGDPTDATNYYGFDPIGDGTTAFTGVLDGNNYSISNLWISRSGEDNVGLIGRLNGTVQDVKLIDATVAGNNYVGGLVGRNVQSGITGITNSYSNNLYNVLDLQLMNNGLDVDYTLMKDINAIDTANWNGSTGFDSIGGSFTGSLDGGGHVISGLRIYRDYDTDMTQLGLFESLSHASVHDLGIVNAYFTESPKDVGQWAAGGGVLAASAYYSDIRNVYTTGDFYVFGTWAPSVAGLVGTVYNSEIAGSHSDVNIYAWGAHQVGGLVGYNYDTGIVSSYASGDVYGKDQVGGFVGAVYEYNRLGEIRSSYATGNVQGSGDMTGGFVGYIADVSLTNCYATGNVTGTTNTGGFAGSGDGWIEYSYASGAVSGTAGSTGSFIGDGWAWHNVVWKDDTHNYGLPNSGSAGDSGITALTKSEMQDATHAAFSDWNFTGGWQQGGTPDGFHTFVWQDMQFDSNFIGGTAAMPMQIHNVNELQFLNYDPRGYYQLANDIDASATASWNSGQGFVPIGLDKYAGWSVTWNFTGTLDGNSYGISDLTIARGDKSALIGQALGATIANLGLIDADISGANNVGGILGTDSGSTISGSFVTGSVTGTGANVGGMVGSASATTIENSYSTADVTGVDKVGGLVGTAASTTNISNSYAAGAVTGTTNKGGFIGSYAGTGVLANNYWDTEASGQATSGGESAGAITGLTTAEMQDEANFSGWDFVNDWNNLAGLAPDLLWEINVWTGSGLWSEAANWSKNAVPTASTKVIFNDASTNASSIDAGFGGSIRNLLMDTGYTGTITQNRSLAVSGDYIQRAGIFTATAPQTDAFSVGKNFSITSTDDSFFRYTGNGLTSGTAYVIYDVYGLQAMQQDLDAYYKLTDNIDASEASSWNSGAGFVPVGKASPYFTGILDGNGYVIDGLTIYRPTEDNVALFADMRGTITNLGITNATITGRDYTGILAGHTFGDYSIRIMNTYTTGSVTGRSPVGGLVGKLRDISISDCYSTATVTGAAGGVESGIGGLAGLIAFSWVYKSYSTGAVSGPEYVGGLAGGFDSLLGAVINDSFSTSEVTSNGTYVGGFLGELFRHGDFGTNNYYTDSDHQNAYGTYESAGSSAFTNRLHNVYTVGTPWNFTSTWTTAEGLYPKLQMEYDVWTGSGVWTTAANWSRGYVPTVLDKALFNSRSTNASSINAGFAGTVGGLFIDTGYTGTLTRNRILTVDGNYRQVDGTFSGTSGFDLNGDFALAGGVFNAPMGLTIGGSWTRTGGTFNPSTYSVTFDAATTGHTITSGGASFYDVAFNNAAGGWTITDPMIVTNDFNLTNGAVTQSGDVAITGNYYQTGGTFTATAPDTDSFTVGNNFTILSTDDSFFRYTGDGLAAGTAYMIYDVYGLQAMKQDLDAHYKLNNDVEAGNVVNWNSGRGFTPVGDGWPGSPFSGSFDGQNHVITNIFIDYSDVIDNYYIGLFGYAQGGTISNVGLVGGSVTGYDSAGGVMGYGNATFNNVYNTATVSARSWAGGLAGTSYGTIDNSYNAGTITATGNGSDGFMSGAGGLAGLGMGTISNSYNTGTISGVAGDNGVGVGGLAGQSDFGVTLSNSYNTGAVSISGRGDAGGLVGNFSGTISDSYNEGSVTGTGTGNDVGGLVGTSQWSAAIANSYNKGAVTGAGDTAGGLVGNIPGGSSPTITNSYSTGTVTGTATTKGGFIGSWDGAGTVTNNFWLKTGSHNPSLSDYSNNQDAPAASINTEATLSNFYNPAHAVYQDSDPGIDDNSWDFTDTWTTIEGEYPKLQMEYSIWTGSGLWSLATNWSRNIAPTSASKVIFNDTSAGDASIDADFSGRIGKLWIDSGYGGTITQGRSLTLATYQQDGGTYDAGANTITITGNWTKSGGTFNAGASTVAFTGTGTQLLDTGGSSLANLSHSGSGTLQLSTNNLTTTGTLTNSAGTFDANGRAVTAAGLTTVSGGTYLAKTGTQTLNGGLAMSGTGSFTGATGIVDAAGVSISGTGTFTAPDATGSLLVSGDWAKTGGTFTPNGGVVTFDGTGAQSLTSGGSSFNAVTVAKTGTLQLQDPLTATGQLTVSSGTLDVNSKALSQGGNWAFTGLTNLGAVTLTGSGKTITSGAGNFSALTITGAYTLVDALTATGELDVQGTLDAASKAISEGGNWIFTGLSNLGDVTLTGAAKTITSGVNQFGNLSISGAYALVDALHINGALNVTGTLDAASKNMTLAQDLDLTKISNPANVTLDGTGYLTSAGKVLNNLSISGIYSLVDALHVNGALSVSGTLDAMGKAMTLAQDLNLTNITSAGNVTLDGTGAIISAGKQVMDLTVSGTYSLSDAVHVNGALNVTGTLNATSKAMTLAQDLNLTNITNAGNVTLDGSGALTSAGKQVTNLTISGDYSLADAVHVNGALNVTGTLDATNKAMTLAQSLDLTKITNAGAVTLDGAGTITSAGKSVFAMTISGAYSLVDGLTVTGDLDVTGTLSAASQTISEGGNWSFTGLSNLGGVVLTGAVKTITSGANQFNALTISGSYSLADAVHVNGALNITGTLDATSKAMTLAQSLNLSNITNAGSVTLDGTGTITSSGKSVGGMTISGAYTLADVLTVAGDLTVSGTLDVASKAISVGGNWAFNPGFSNLGDVTLTGAAKTITSGVGQFNNLTISGSYSLADAVHVNGALNVTGTLNATGRAMTMASSLDLTNVSNAGPVTLDGSGSLTSGGRQLIDLVISGAYSLADAAHVNGALTVTGTLNATNKSMTLAQNLDLTNISNAGAVTLDGSGTITSAGKSMAGLAVSGAYSLVDALTVTGNLDVTGTLNAASKAISEGGNWVFTGLSNLGAVTLTGSGATITSGANQFNNLAISGAYTLVDALHVNGIFNVTGTLDAASKAMTMASSLDLTNIANAGNVTLDGTGFLTSGGKQVTDLTISGTYSLADAVHVNGALNVTGTLDAVNKGMTLAQNLDLTKISNVGSVTLDGTGSVTSAGKSVTAMTITGAYTLADALTVTGELDVQGTLNAASKAISEGGNWSFNGLSNLGTVTLTGAGKTITSGGNEFGNLAISGTYSLADAIHVNGALNVTGTLDGASKAMTLAQNLNLANITSAGAVTLDGSGTITSAGRSVNSLTVTGAYTLVDALTVTNTLDVQGAGSLDIASKTISLGGNWTFPSGISNLGAVILTGSGKTITSGANSFSALSITGSYTLADALTVTGDLDVSGTLNAASKAISEGGNWSFNGLSNLGTVTLTGAGKTITSGAGEFNNVTISGTYAVADSIHVNGALSVTGTLNAANNAMTLAQNLDLTNITNAGNVTLDGTGTITSVGKSVAGLTISGAYTLADALTVTNDLSVPGSLNVASKAISVGGNWAFIGGITNLGAVTLTGSGKTITSGGNEFGSLAISGIYSLVDALHVNGALNVTGTLDAASKAMTLAQSLDLTNISNVGNVTLDGTGTITSASKILNGLTISGAYSLADALHMNGALNVTGTLNAANKAMTLAGNLDLTKISNAGTVTLDGSGTITSAGKNITDLVVSGAYSLADALSVTGDLDVQGTLNAASKAISEGGNWLFTGLSNLGAVTLTGSGKTITSDGSEFSGLAISGVYSLVDALHVNGALNVTGTLDAASKAMTFAQSLNLSNISNVGNVTLDGSGILTSAGKAMNDLVVSGSYILADAIQVDGALSVTGTLDAASKTMTLAQSLDLTKISNARDVVLTGSGTLTTAGKSVNDLTVSGTYSFGSAVTVNGDLNLTSGTLTQNSTLSVGADLNLTSGTFNQSGSLTIAGDLNLISGTFNQSGSLSTVGDLNLTSGTFNQSANLAIGGDYVQTGGAFRDAAPLSHTFTVTGSFSVPFATAGFRRYTGSGTVSDPFIIRNIYDLQAVKSNLTSHFKLSDDLLNRTLNASAAASWNSNTGFDPIGDLDHAFTGSLNGNGKIISNLEVDRAANDYLGLFGHIGSTGSVSNLALEDVSIYGRDYVGGLVGLNAGSLANVYTTGVHTVSGTSFVGGLAGGNTGSIANAYSSARVTGTNKVGGLVGANTGSGTIDKTYAVGYVTGTSSNVGGLVGANTSNAANSVSNSFWDISSTGQAARANVTEGTGVTVTETTNPMLSQSNYLGWDFQGTWVMDNSGSLPHFQFRYPEGVRGVSGYVYINNTVGLVTTQSKAGAANTVSIYYSSSESGAGTYLAATATGADSRYYVVLGKTAVADSNYVIGESLNGSTRMLASSGSVYPLNIWASENHTLVRATLPNVEVPVDVERGVESVDRTLVIPTTTTTPTLTTTNPTVVIVDQTGAGSTQGGATDFQSLIGGVPTSPVTNPIVIPSQPPTTTPTTVATEVSDTEADLTQTQTLQEESTNGDISFTQTNPPGREPVPVDTDDGSASKTSGSSSTTSTAKTAGDGEGEDSSTQEVATSQNNGKGSPQWRDVPITGFFNGDDARKFMTDVRVLEGTVYVLDGANAMSLLSRGESMRVLLKSKPASDDQAKTQNLDTQTKTQDQDPNTQHQQTTSQTEEEELLSSVESDSMKKIAPNLSTKQAKEMKLFLKADTQSSVDALTQALQNINSEKSHLNVVRGTLGAIQENDVKLAKLSKASIIGLRVTADPRAQVLAETEGVVIRLYNSISEAVSGIGQAMEGNAEPESKKAVENKISPVEPSAVKVAKKEPMPAPASAPAAPVVKPSALDMALSAVTKAFMKPKVAPVSPEPVSPSMSEEGMKAATPVVMERTADGMRYGTLRKPGKDVFVKCRGGKWMPAADGMVILPGDEVKTASAGSVEVMLDGGKVGRVEVKEGSLFRIAKAESDPVTGDKATLLELAIGKILVKAESLRGNSRFEVKTPTALTGVRGTLFEVTVKEKT